MENLEHLNQESCQAAAAVGLEAEEAPSAFLSHQVGGSTLLLEEKVGDCAVVLKPSVSREIRWYEEMYARAPLLVQWCPAYFGTRDLEQMAPEEGAGPRRTRRECAMICLEDLTAGYSKPCILDCKMGTQQQGHDATPAKAASMQRKCARTTSSSLGFRLCGLKVPSLHLRSSLPRGCGCLAAPV